MMMWRNMDRKCLGDLLIRYGHRLADLQPVSSQAKPASDRPEPTLPDFLTKKTPQSR